MEITMLATMEPHVILSHKLILPADRSERLHYIKHQFPLAKGVSLSKQWVGGRHAAIKQLNQVDGIAYNRNRNFLNGAVTHLSPYLRHGCITLKEAFDHIQARYGITAEKLIFELAWRDYWRQVWYMQGNKILSDMETSKVLLGAKPLPDFVKKAQTGLPCMDAFIHDLIDDGYVHNHARMWFAAYVLHWLKVDWRAAADWYESYLLDGDLSSNHLSWQWIATTNSSKPYYFNKENLARFTGEKYCTGCTAKCPFDKSYEDLQAQLFDTNHQAVANVYTIVATPKQALSGLSTVAIYVHDEMLSPAHPLMQQPFPKIFVFDNILHGHWSINRLQFMADCLSEMPEVEVWMGDTRQVLQERGVGQVITQNTPNSAIKALLQPFSPKWQAEEAFVNLKLDEKNLRRFSKYWEKVGPVLLGDKEYRKP